MQVRSLAWEGPLEEGMAPHSSILAWRIPWIEEPDGPQSMGSQSWTWLSIQHTCTHTHFRDINILSTSRGTSQSALDLPNTEDPGSICVTRGPDSSPAEHIPHWDAEVLTPPQSSSQHLFVLKRKGTRKKDKPETEEELRCSHHLEKGFQS